MCGNLSYCFFLFFLFQSNVHDVSANVSNVYLRNRKHVRCFYRVIQTWVEVWENKKCCGNTNRRRVFPQLVRVLPNVTSWQEKGKQLVNLNDQNVISLCLRHHYVNSTSKFCVSIELYEHNFQPICVHAFLGLFSKLFYSFHKILKSVKMISLVFHLENCTSEHRNIVLKVCPWETQAGRATAQIIDFAPILQLATM